MDFDAQDRWFSEYEKTIEAENERLDAAELDRLERLDDHAGPLFRCEDPEGAWIAEMEQLAAEEEAA